MMMVMVVVHWYTGGGIPFCHHIVNSQVYYKNKSERLKTYKLNKVFSPKVQLSDMFQMHHLQTEWTENMLP